LVAFFLWLAALEVWPEAAGAQSDRLARVGIGAEFACAAEGIAFLLAELPRVTAFRVVGAAYERAEAAELQTQTPIAAIRAGARVFAIVAGHEEMRTHHLVEMVDHFGDAQFFRFANGGGEIAPEIAQQLLPVQIAGGDFIQLLFEIGGEAVL